MLSELLGVSIQLGLLGLSMSHEIQGDSVRIYPDDEDRGDDIEFQFVW